MDDDNDGISDIDELKFGLNPLDKSDAEDDFDKDGFSNSLEIYLGYDIYNKHSYPKWVPIITGSIYTVVPY